MGTLVFVLALSVFSRDADADQLTFTDFEAKVAAGQVESATIKERDQIVAGELTDGTSYETTFVAEYADELVDELKKAGVTVESDPQAPNELIGTLVTVILPVLLIGGVLLFVMNRSQGGGGRVMQFGRSKHKTVNKDAPKTSFADVAGVDEAIEELQEVKDYLQNPGKFQAMGAKIPRGVLLFGPPGTGKTLLARAVAGEAGVPFFTISGSDFVEMFVGVGAARVRDLFEQAKATAPAIVFIDEIDAVGRQRGAGLGGGHDEREQTLNQLLVEMDGFDQRSTVILMAATNRPDILDPALLRPGRFDRQVVIDRPDLEGRKAILRVHARGKPFDATVDLSVLARRTPGFTGADLANVINEGALLAARRNLRAISMKEIEEAVDRVMAGPERKSRIMDEQERRLIAYHEGGHAMVAHVLPNTDEVHKITVIPRGRALGYTLTLPEQDKFLMSREQMRDELAMLMGGRVAEEIVAGDVTTGAANDIERATKVARQMVTEYGMSDTIGPRTLGVKQGEVFLGRDWGSTPDYSDAVAFEIDQEVRALIDEAHDVALDILTVNRDKLDQLAERLLAVETLERDEVVAFFGEVERRSPREVGVRGAGLGVSRQPKPGARRWPRAERSTVWRPRERTVGHLRLLRDPRRLAGRDPGAALRLWPDAGCRRAAPLVSPDRAPHPRRSRHPLSPGHGGDPRRGGRVGRRPVDPRWRGRCAGRLAAVMGRVPGGARRPSPSCATAAGSSRSCPTPTPICWTPRSPRSGCPWTIASWHPRSVRTSPPSATGRRSSARRGQSGPGTCTSRRRCSTTSSRPRSSGLPAVWINRLGETSMVPRSAELPDLTDLPATLDRLVPA